MLKLATVALVATLALSSTVSADPCAAYLSCELCIKAPVGCGWCSYPIKYKDGTTGPKCAGTGPDTPKFTCPAIFSRFTCQRGYECQPSGQCGLAPPGQGSTKAECESTCRPGTVAPAAKVYSCDHATKTCHVAPSGTPGAAGLPICEAQCKNISTAAPGPVQKTYICNLTSFKCDPTTPGHGSSEEVCELTCNQANIGWECNTTSAQCYKVQPPGGSTQKACQEACGKHSNTPLPTLPPAPGPPPEYVGLWRGVEIQNGYEIAEWDMKINHTEVIIVQNPKSGARVIQRGTPYHKRDSPILEFWILLTSGPGAGKYIRSVGDATGEKGPSTTFVTMAISQPGGTSPASIDSAMEGTNGDKVLALSACIIGDQNCIFYLPPGVGAAFEESGFDGIAEPLEQAKRNAAAAAASKLHVLPKVKKIEQQQLPLGFNDNCSKHAQSCQQCLEAGPCGWCSTDVTYQGGVRGTQCAGTTGATTPFACLGTFSTDSCEVGYKCLSGSFKCVVAQPGDGAPLAQCEATCKPTPPPNPRVPQYQCNLATHQCSLCRNQNSCPGSMPKGQCEALCAHPLPGPTPSMVGVWRGVQIQHGYPFAETDLVLNKTGAFYYVNGILTFSASVISLGSDVMVWTTKSGERYSVLYQMASVYQGLYWQGTFAVSAADGSIPSSFNTPMHAKGEKEMVLAKCLKAPCKFSTV